MIIVGVQIDSIEYLSVVWLWLTMQMVLLKDQLVLGIQTAEAFTLKRRQMKKTESNQFLTKAKFTKLIEENVKKHKKNIKNVPN